MSQLNVLKTFNAIVVDAVAVKQTPNLSLVSIGVVTDFTPSKEVVSVLKSHFEPLAIKTLFTREERLNADPLELISKQILHYIEVYGLQRPGLFDLVVKEGVIIKPTFVTGITREELAEKVQKLLYANAPIKDVEAIADIINEFDVPYDVNQIANNELRIKLFDPNRDVFTDGQDAVRYVVYKTTDKTMLIKSKEVIQAVKVNALKIDPKFLAKHQRVLSHVFNRFKPILLALKQGDRKTIINRISHASKRTHKPVYESVSKRFLSLAIKNPEKVENLLTKLSVRDKFKILNLISYKSLGLDVDAFVIRNGKLRIEAGREILSKDSLAVIENKILDSLKVDLAHLKGKRVLLDPSVDYALPISRKQTLGNLPFGTRITIEGDEISSGVFWRNEWGATDLDLSTVDLKGNRTGWGRYSGYGDGDITFSGDVTYADGDGAMEFMTSSSKGWKKAKAYGLFVNIFSGNSNAECELVIGSAAKSRWITDVKIREKTQLVGRGSVIGFVKGNVFTVYQGMLNNKAANFSEFNPVLKRALADCWTVADILTAIDVEYDYEANPEKEYDYNLTYSQFSLDKLEEVFYK